MVIRKIKQKKCDNKNHAQPPQTLHLHSLRHSDLLRPDMAHLAKGADRME